MTRCFSLFLLCLLLVAIDTNAAVYYVDAIEGNDNNAGTTKNSAWKSLAKVSGISLAPGDSVNLKCGQLWRETLNFHSSGTAAQPINFGSYGDNCSAKKPEIRGSDNITGWSRYSGNIYVAPFKNTAEVSQVFVDDKLIRSAKHPNSGYWHVPKDGVSEVGCPSPPKPYDPFAFLGTCSISLSLAANHPEIKGNDLVGAGIHIKTLDYWIDSSKIAVYGGNGVAGMNTRTRSVPISGNDYFLDNKLWMLDEAGEWYYDKSEGKLYVWLPDGTDPSGHVLEASIRSYGVYAGTQAAANYVALSGLLVNQAAVDGIHIESASNTLIDNVEVRNSGRTGILLYQSNNARIQSSKILNSRLEAIKLRQSPNSTVTDNTVIDSGTPGFYLGSPDTSFGAIVADTSSGANITKNTVTNAGYIGIRIETGSSVSDNTVSNTCLVLLDCGAIYVGGVSLTNSDPPSVISGNIIANSGVASLPGLAAGIYLDDFVNHVSVTNNTVTNAERGIFLHLAHDNSVVGNTINGSRVYSLSIGENISPTYAGVTRNNNITGNKFVQTNNLEVVHLEGAYGNISFATFSKNSYSTLQSDGVIIQTAYQRNYPSGTVTTARYTLSSWQSVALQDLNSILVQALPSPPKVFDVKVSD